MSKNLRFLFYLVHPAKFHFHKVQINKLISKGHKVDILINSKDILEDLVKEERWNYSNIFPEGRKIKGLHVYLSALIAIVKTVHRLLIFTKGKKYDLFIGDLLTVIGKIKGIDTLFPADSPLTQVPEQSLFLHTATHPIAPHINNLQQFNKKTIKYKGYKALSHLHPNHFKPNKRVLFESIQKIEKYYLIRCTGFFATHDIGKSGISNELLLKIIEELKPHGKVIITSERCLPKELEMYYINFNKNDISHYMYFADLFISDSTTMSAEAAVLGTPSIEFDDYHHEIDQMLELEKKYKLIHCYRTHQEDQFLYMIRHLVKQKDLKQVYQKRREILLNDCIDVSAFLVWLFEKYPTSKIKYFNNPNIQETFT